MTPAAKIIKLLTIIIWPVVKTIRNCTTRSADVLRRSGLAGLTLGTSIGNYQVMLRSPMMLGGSQAAPSWIVASHVHLLRLSLIILFYSFFVVDLFERYAGIVTGAAIIGQWVEPLSIYPLEALQIGVFGLILQLDANLSLIVIPVFLVGYARSGWGTAGAYPIIEGIH